MTSLYCNIKFESNKNKLFLRFNFIYLSNTYFIRFHIFLPVIRSVEKLTIRSKHTYRKCIRRIMLAGLLIQMVSYLLIQDPRACAEAITEITALDIYILCLIQWQKKTINNILNMKFCSNNLIVNFCNKIYLN